MAPVIGLETKIFRALSDALDAFRAGYLVGGAMLDIAYPGVNYVPVTGKPYLRPSYLPAPSVSRSLSHSDEFFGLWQIDVFWPVNKGITAPMEVASAIMAHYRGRRLFRDGIKVEINRPPYAATPQQEPGLLQIPVTIPYRVFE